VKKKIFSTPTILFLIILVISLNYILFFSKTPLLSSSDVLHHSWIANQIAMTGEIPLDNPMTGSFDILYFSPLFQILGAQISLITGYELIYIYIALNILLIPLYILGIFIITKKIFKSEIIGLFSALLFFLFNTATYLSKHVIFLEIKQATVAIFLLLCTFYITLSVLQYNKQKINTKKILVLALFLITIPLFHQFTSFALFSVLTTFFIVLFILFPLYRKKILILSVTTVICVIIVASFNFSTLFVKDNGYLTGSAHSFTKNYSETLSTGSSQINHNIIKDILQDVYHPIILFLFLSGAVFYMIALYKKHIILQSEIILLIIWISTFLFYSLQAIGNFQFLPSRFLNWSVLPISLFAGYGLYQYLLLFKKNYYQLLVTLSILLITIISTVGLSSDKIYTNENISFNELKSFIKIKEYFADKPGVKIVADPFLGYKLITLSNLQLTYSYQRTGMYRDDSLDFDVVENFFYGEAETAYRYAIENEAQYAIINHDDKKRYYKDASYDKLDDPTKYQKIYSDFEGTDDEIIIYEILKNNK